LAALRPPADRAEPVLVWVDVHVPVDAKAGDYQATCELREPSSRTAGAAATLPVRLTVHDFILPDTPHLQMMGQVDWRSLARLYPSQLEPVNPRLLNRRDARYTPAVRTLD